VDGEGGLRLVLRRWRRDDGWTREGLRERKLERRALKVGLMRYEQQ
jgi:hypothetical protein